MAGHRCHSLQVLLRRPFGGLLGALADELAAVIEEVIVSSSRASPLPPHPRQRFLIAPPMFWGERRRVTAPELALPDPGHACHQPMALSRYQCRFGSPCAGEPERPPIVFCFAASLSRLGRVHAELRGTASSRATRRRHTREHVRVGPQPFPSPLRVASKAYIKDQEAEHHCGIALTATVGRPSKPRAGISDPTSRFDGLGTRAAGSAGPH
jgi:hypothetical protein